MPFKNYSLTKGGQLTIGQILSPNYVAGVSGWEVRKDGSAEFNDLTIRGDFMGNDYEINDNGEFFYNGTPANGNLIASITNTGGTDPYGNAYPKGIRVRGTGASAGAYVWLDPDLGRIVIQNELSGYQAICDGGSFSMSTPSSTANPATYSVQDSPLAGIIESPSDGTHGAAEMKMYAGTSSADPYIAALDPIVVPSQSTPNIPSPNVPLFASTDGAVSYVDGGDAQVYRTGRRSIVLSNSTACAASPGTAIFSSAVSARTYRIHALLFLSISGAAQQVSVNVTMPGSANGQIATVLSRAATLVATTNFGLNSLTGLGASASLASGSTYVLLLDGTMVVPSSGTFTITVAGTNANDITVAKNSAVDIMPV